jgi:hypothetical protein
MTDGHSDSLMISAVGAGGVRHSDDEASGRGVYLAYPAPDKRHEVVFFTTLGENPASTRE